MNKQANEMHVRDYVLTAISFAFIQGGRCHRFVIGRCAQRQTFSWMVANIIPRFQPIERRPTARHKGVVVVIFPIKALKITLTVVMIATRPLAHMTGRVLHAALPPHRPVAGIGPTGHGAGLGVDELPGFRVVMVAHALAVADALGGGVARGGEGVDLEQISGGVEAHEELAGGNGGQEGVWIF